MYAWLDHSVVSPSNLLDHYKLHAGLFVGRRLKQRGYLLWNIVVWTIWIQRNEIIFKNSSFDFMRIMDIIKSCSWEWISTSSGMFNPFSDRCVSPMECLKLKKETRDS